MVSRDFHPRRVQFAAASFEPARRAHPGAVWRTRRARAPSRQPAGTPRAALEHHPNLLASRLWQEGAAAVAEFVQILDEHRKTCEREGKYIEADIAKKRLAELRQHEENRRQEGLRSRQIAQRLGVEEAHMLEFQQARPA